eukprot:6164903-Prorocentrum_lima.AAC.1
MESLLLGGRMGEIETLLLLLKAPFLFVYQQTRCGGEACPDPGLSWRPQDLQSCALPNYQGCAMSVLLWSSLQAA